MLLQYSTYIQIALKYRRSTELDYIVPPTQDLVSIPQPAHFQIIFCFLHYIRANLIAHIPSNMLWRKSLRHVKSVVSRGQTVNPLMYICAYFP